MKKWISVLLFVIILGTSLIANAEYTDGVFQGVGAGLMGNITVSVTVVGGKITSVEVLNHTESAGISDPAIDTIPAAIVNAQSPDIDVVAGATLTSRGIMAAVKDALNLTEKVEGIPFETPDVIVIGAGMAGMSAAARAAELGLNTLVLEQTGSIGGSAMLAGGTLLGNNTRMQAEKGIKDSPELAFADFVRLGGVGRFNEELARKYTQISGAAVDWLDDLGTDFGEREPFFGVYVPLNIARNYSAAGGAATFISALNNSIEPSLGKNAYILYNTKVTDLTTNEAGAVTGVKATAANGMEVFYNAPATIICTGGSGGNEGLLKKYNFANVLTTSPRFVTGDGYTWLEKLDAVFTNMDVCAAYAGAIPSGDFFNFKYFNTTNGSLWIDLNGNRMANETGADSTIKSLSWTNALENIVYNVYSDEMILEGKSIFNANGFGQPLENTEELMDALLSKGVAWKADTIADLAMAAGLPVDAFTATVSTYNEGCATGADVFGRIDLTPMENGPFYAVKTVPFVMLTNGGPMMNNDCQVYRKDGTLIEGVYIAGEIVGMSNVGAVGGIAHGNCVVWGKHAAEVIAKELGK